MTSATTYVLGSDDEGPALLAGIVRTLAPAIVAGGIASEDELGLDTLQQRIAHDCAQARATIVTPGMVGAWGRRPGSADG
jgi:hypothetical protein